MPGYVYARDLIPELKQLWNRRTWKEDEIPSLPSDDELEILLDVSYHASFLTEEQRRLGFRLVYGDRTAITDYVAGSAEFHKSLSISPFSHPRPFDVSELLRLAPATDYTRMLICVSPCTDKRKKKPNLEIWAVLDSGSSWWSFTHGDSRSGYPPPNFLTISSTEPGHLSISREGWALLSLRNGAVSEPSWTSPLSSGPVSDFLTPARKAFKAELLERLDTESWSDDGVDEDYPARFFDEYLQRVLFQIREKHHGGTLLLVPGDFTGGDQRLVDLAKVKYELEYSRGWDLSLDYLEAHRRYYDLYFGAYQAEEVSQDVLTQVARWEDRMEETSAAITDSVLFTASLSAVDGALLMTDRLKLIGFGTEIVSTSQVTEMDISLVPSGKRARSQSIEAYGTRHRTAIRFCSRYADAVALIVSSDGGVKAVKRVGSRVVMWPDINSGAFGL